MSSSDISGGLHAASLFAIGRADALNFLPADNPGAVRSFWSVAVCFPLFLCLRLMAWSQSGGPDFPAHALVLDSFSFVIGWVGYLLLSSPIARALGAQERWPRYVAGWNWANVAQYTLLLLASLPGLAGVPPWLDQAIQLAAFGWALWLEWFVARVALQVGPAAAAGLVALDLGLGLVLAGLNASLIWG